VQENTEGNIIKIYNVMPLPNLLYGNCAWTISEKVQWTPKATIIALLKTVQLNKVRNETNVIMLRIPDLYISSCSLFGV
jgi:hypothetical protein